MKHRASVVVDHDVIVPKHADGALDLLAGGAAEATMAEVEAVAARGRSLLERAHSWSLQGENAQPRRPRQSVYSNEEHELRGRYGAPPIYSDDDGDDDLYEYR